ncbi:TIGR01620 family protein [Thalassotalea ponticola]|uniref:YcjF family protein n=1 Tax=Thalassotalea ponticola TaxID=1523392 RepID=UPI0025B61150|nr:TIGR01620 family protein [Thalassotalea ponticola]MDN3653175.1 TIGR01620 family protein [Thalassotalea ponticola]
MKDDKEQQQILFDNNDEEDSSSSSLPPDALVLPEQAWQAVEQQVEQVEQQAQRNKPNWLWRIIAALFTLLVVIESIEFFANGFTNAPVITSLYAIFVGLLLVVVGKYAVQELLSLRELSRHQHDVQRAHDLIHDKASFDAKTFCQSITDKLPVESHQIDANQFLDSLDSHLQDKEILQLYSQRVLSDVDEQAVKHIASSSSEAVLMVAVSPLAIVDMLLMMWRNLNMINKIAGLYGVKLGYWSRIKLIKQVLANMAYAGASELILDFGVDLFGVEALGRFSSRAAQGLGAGILTSRLGLKTLQFCRPIPFDQQHIGPSLADVRRAMIKQLKRVFKSSASTVQPRVELEKHNQR